MQTFRKHRAGLSATAGLSCSYFGWCNAQSVNDYWIVSTTLYYIDLLLGYQSVPGGTSMRQARSAGQLPIRAQSGNSARPITGQQQQMMNSQRIMQGIFVYFLGILFILWSNAISDNIGGNWHIMCLVNFWLLWKLTLIYISAELLNGMKTICSDKLLLLLPLLPSPQLLSIFVTLNIFP